MTEGSDRMSDDAPGREAREWIREQLDRAGRRIVGEMAEPRVRPWSVVVRIRPATELPRSRSAATIAMRCRVDCGSC
jgi:hypothetical protein